MKWNSSAIILLILLTATFAHSFYIADNDPRYPDFNRYVDSQDSRLNKTDPSIYSDSTDPRDYIPLNQISGVKSTQGNIILYSSNGSVSIVPDYINSRINFLASGSGSDNNKVGVSINDTIPDYLFSKLQAGTGITISIQNPGGDENILISATGSGTDTNCAALSSCANLVYQTKDANLHDINSTGISDFNSIRVAPTSSLSNSTSTGGAIRLINTSNNGAGLIIYSNNGASQNGRLLNVRSDNNANTQAAIHIDYNGTGNALEVVHNGQDSTAQAFNVVSTNLLDSAFTVTSNTTSRGVQKLLHVGSAGDSSSSGISIDLQNDGTASQGIFVDSTASTGTTGALMKLRNRGIEYFVVDKNGGLKIQNSISNALRIDTNLGLTLLNVDTNLNKINVKGTLSANDFNTAFTDLNDVPNTYTGQATKYVQVNLAETGLQFSFITSAADTDTNCDNNPSCLLTGTINTSFDANFNEDVNIQKQLTLDGNLFAKDANTFIGNPTAPFDNDIFFTGYSYEAFPDTNRYALGIPANTYAFAVKASCPTGTLCSGMYFRSIAPAAFEMHISGVPIFRLGASTAQGAFFMSPRVTDPAAGTTFNYPGTLYVKALDLNRLMINIGSLATPNYREVGSNLTSQHVLTDVNIGRDQNIHQNLYVDGNFLKGAHWSLFSAVGTTCNTLCGSITVDAPWTCAQAITTAGGASTCGQALVAVNCLCGN